MMEAPPSLLALQSRIRTVRGWHVGPNEVTLRLSQGLSRPVLGKFLLTARLTVLQFSCYFHLSEMRMIRESGCREFVVSLTRVECYRVC